MKPSEIQKLVKTIVRSWFTSLAELLNKRFGSRITPDAITYVGFAAHVPIALLIAQGHLFIGGLLLIVFGLFDTLDGALARVQGVSSANGMFLDASTDRLKEMILYTGFVYFFANDPTYTVLAPVAATFACGLSLSVSYVKAKGEAALAAQKDISHAKLNRIFEDGLGSFEIRMALLVIGCLIGFPEFAIVIIIILTINTLITRMRRITKALTA